MADIWQMVRGGHWPTLLGAWLHLTVSFMVWLLIGALSLPMAGALGLSGTDLSVLVALPLLGGAVLRVLGGWGCDWFGAKNTAVAILLGELAVLLWGWLFTGWLLNLFQALQHSQPLDPWLMLRWCGVVIPPLGGIIGWFPG